MKLPDINIVGFSKAIGLSISYLNAEEYEISFCILNKKKGEIELSESKTGLKTTEELFSLLPAGLPVLIHISGKVVLSKSFRSKAVEEGAEKDDLMPMQHAEDFYRFEVEDETNTGISICRCSIVDEWLNEFSNQKLDVAGVCLGSYLVKCFWDYSLTNEREIPINTGVLNLDDDNSYKMINSVGDDNTNISVSGQEIPSTLTTAYIFTLNFLLNLNQGDFHAKSPEGVIEDLQFKNLFNKTKYIALAIILIVLLVNFLAYDTLRNKEVVLSKQIQLNSGTIQKRDSLETILKAKESFIDYIGNNRTYYSYFLDEIAATVPSKVVLNELEINPLLGKIQKNEMPEFGKKLILTGSSSTSLVLNKWVNDMETLSWIEEIIVLEYSRDEEIGKGVFSIEIRFKK